MKLPYYPKEYPALLRLGIPITIAQIGFTLQGLADTLMVGQHSARELAAAGFVNSIFTMSILLVMGYSMSAVSRIGALYSQGRRQEITEVLKSSLVTDLLQGLLVTGILTVIYFCLPYMGQSPELLPLMQEYYIILLPGILMVALYNAFKPFCDSINDTKVSMWILLSGNVWNIFFNWVLIYGHLGFPEMGIAGAAWATTSSRLLMLLLFVIVFFLTPRYKEYLKYWKDTRVSLKQMRILNRLGWPIGIQMTMEIAAFAGAALFLGWGGKTWDGVTALAAHQVAIVLANLIYMFFIGIGSAIAIRVSNYHGLEDLQGVKDAAHAGYQMILLVSIIASAIVYAYRYSITPLFISGDDPEMLAKVTDVVVATCLPLILYQFGDGMQTAYVNALRGYGDVKVLMGYSFLAYIVISIPLSFIFCILLDGGCFGLWMGFPFGLTTAAILYRRRFSKTISRRIPK